MAVAIANVEREALRERWLLPGATTDQLPESVLPPAAEPWFIHDLLVEMSSGTRPCTTCCTQCCQKCCWATK
jgi:hypothetical protein